MQEEGARLTMYQCVLTGNRGALARVPVARPRDDDPRASQPFRRSEIGAAR